MADFSLSEYYSVVLIVAGALTAIATVANIVGAPARHLRKTLAQDAKLVPIFRGKAKTDLIRDLDRRSYRLLGHLRSPFMIAYDALLLAIVVTCFLWLGIAPANLRELRALGESPLEMAGGGQILFSVMATATFFVVMKSISSRAAARIEYLYDALGDDEARHITRILAFPFLTLILAFSLSLFTLITWNGFVISETWEDGLWIVFIIMPWMLILLYPIFRFLSKQPFIHYIFFYINVGFAGSDIPSLRPERLGQTSEDFEQYRKQWERRFHGTHRRELKKQAKRKERERLRGDPHEDPESP